MSDFVIEMNSVRKSFRKIEALRGLNLRVPAGSLYGLLGRNGAGKTTAIKLLMEMLKPDGGDARIFGLPVGDRQNGIEIRRRIGFVSEEKELYPYMTDEDEAKSDVPGVLIEPLFLFFAISARIGFLEVACTQRDGHQDMGSLKALPR